MSKRKKVEGTCKICGAIGKLSFEHVPPKAAFNDRMYHYAACFEEILKLDQNYNHFDSDQIFNYDGFLKKQGSIGYHSLCERCNNNTGSWYGRDFVNWAHQSMGILLKANGKPSLIYPTFFYPLRVIKQIVTMFFSINIEGFREMEPELVKFVLDRDDRFLSNKYRIFCYYNFKGRQRYIGNTVLGKLDGSEKNIYMSELAFSPFGFVMTVDSHKPDARLFDITFFSRYQYNQWTDYYQRFRVLPTYLPHIPGDYREIDEIRSAIRSSKNSRV